MTARSKNLLKRPAESRPFCVNGEMTLALHKPFPPMEALSVDEIPEGKNWQYEPKWDGFRCLIFRDGAAIELQSKSGQSLTRYFPEMVVTVASLKPKRFVLDGEIVVPSGRAFSFDDLLQRIHPAASRVKRLAGETPALLIVFDLLIGDDGQSLVKTPLASRRKLLEAFARKYLPGQKTIRLSPATTKIAVAKKWLKRVGATLDGIIAKRATCPTSPATALACRRSRTTGLPTAWWAAFATTKASRVVGSLLLGLYDGQGLLNHVGFTSALKSEEKQALTVKLEKLIAAPASPATSRAARAAGRPKRSAEWQPLKPKLVVEVCYDHFSGGRFRHGTRLLRWRPDKAPRQCTMDQVRAEKSGSDEAVEVIKIAVAAITAATFRFRAALRRQDRASR